MQKGDRADFASGTRVLMNRNVDAAVIENDSGVILGQGLAYDRCQVGVVTNIDDADHLGDFDINETERMFNVFRTQVDVVLPTGAAVLNARDPRVVEMAELSDGAVIFFGIDPALPAITAHLQQDGRAVFVRDGGIVLARAPTKSAWPTSPRFRSPMAAASPSRSRTCWPPSAPRGRSTFRSN